jgi:hypothetical protein
MTRSGGSASLYKAAEGFLRQSFAPSGWGITSFGESKMVRKWLQAAINNDYLPAIAALKNTAQGRRKAEALDLRIRQDWDEHGATALSQKQGLSDELRRYLKDHLGEDHWVLDYLGLTTEEYAEINELKQGRVAKRNEATQQLDNPDAIVAKAVELIGKPGWDDIAAGLAVLTGRRVAEILSTAQFQKRSRWSVSFRGALKRRGEEGLEFEIPTLTTADRVLRALSRLRDELPDAVAMDAKSINRKFELAVAKACDRAFSGLVPTRAGKDSLYTHLFRAVYATIATFWYCPPSVNETEFKAAIQGHYAIQEAGSHELRRSLAASRHYSDYEISDQEVAHYNGMRKGIKLGVGGVLPIEVFKEAWEKGELMKSGGEMREPRGRSSFRLWQTDKLRLDKLLERFDGSQPDRFHALLNQIEGQMEVSIEGVDNATDDAIHIHTQTDLDEEKGAIVPLAMTNLDQEEAIAPTANRETTSEMGELVGAIQQLVEVQMALFSKLEIPSHQKQSEQKERSRSSATQNQAVGGNRDISTQRAERMPQTRAAADLTALRINRAIDAIFAYNDAPGRRHNEKWAIGINTLKAFVKSQEAIVAAIGGRNRKGELVQGSRQLEIEQHHQKHQIDPDKHNYKHRGKLRVDQVVGLE